MIDHAALLKDAARKIDEYDAEITTLNDLKKDLFGNIRETIAPDQFKAWREAVKLRQKRRVDKTALEAHDARVWAMLSMLEAETPRTTVKTAVAPLKTPAIGIVDETAPYAQAHDARDAAPSHDPATGEIFISATQFVFPPFEIPEPRDSTGAGGHPTEETDDVGGSGGPDGRVCSSMKSSGPADLSLPDFLRRRRVTA